MHALWPVAFLWLAVSGADKPAVATFASVRASGGAATLLMDTAARSAIVRDLIARIAATDVIVYVEVTPSPQVATARTKLVTATATARFLRIGVSSATPPIDAPALLAHELQHAVEIAEHAEVRTDEGMRQLYAAIGHTHGADRYESDAARQVERLVRSELRSSASGVKR
jgi:hypothetical protein